MVDEVFAESRQGLFLTAKENAKEFVELVRSYTSIDTFLHRNEHLYLTSVNISELEQSCYINIKTDIDGCVLELKSLQAIKYPVRHITLFPNEIFSLRLVSPILKKHVHLHLYSKNQLQNFSKSLGFQLMYEYGWETWIGIIPDEEVQHEVEIELTLRRAVFQIFLNLRQLIEVHVENASKRKIAINTWMKNNLNDIRKLSILPDDSSTVLSLIQKSIDVWEVPSGLKKIIFSFRFGEKLSTNMTLDVITEEVKDITVHIAANISSVYNIDLLWSRSGLQSIIGNRGVLTTCMSFSECGNFQTNLDGRLIDISQDLKSVCIHPTRLRFLQLYSDLPHKRPETRFHPISGIVCCGCLLPSTASNAFEKDAKKYLSVVENNFNLMHQGVCRLEIVISLPTVINEINASNYISIENIKKLLDQKPLVVPFLYSSVHNSIFPCLKEIGKHLIHKLHDINEKYSKTSNCTATWTAFQCELAIEKLLWGHPLCYISNTLSINLGPGVGSPSRCLSDDLGFLALDESNSTGDSEQYYPSLCIWTKSDLIKRRIEKMIGFHDCLNGSYPVIGQKALYILLQDLFEMSVSKFNLDMTQFYLRLKTCSDLPDTEIVGSVTVKQLADILSSTRHTKYPMVYGVVLQMLRKSNLPVAEVIEKGIMFSDLKYFPALRLYDCNRNPVLQWSIGMKFNKIVGISVEDLTQFAKSLTDATCIEIEKRGLIFISKLKTVNGVFPWVIPCLRKIPRKEFSEKQLLIMLTFISCIAFIMDGWYVEYKALIKLEKELPLKQLDLRCLEIQSRYLLNSVYFHKIYRLHPSIPFKLTSTYQINTTTKQVSTSTETNMEAELERQCEIVDNDILTEENIEEYHSSCLPSNSQTRWTSQELSILAEIKSMAALSLRQRYQKYRDICRESNVPSRTFFAFKSRYKRLNV